MVKLTNLWENWAVVRENCGMLGKSKFDKAVYPGTGIRNVSPGETVGVVLDMFVKFPEFRGLFDGYSEVEASAIASALKDPANRAKIGAKIEAEWAGQMFNGYATPFMPADPDDIGYDAVRDGIAETVENDEQPDTKDFITSGGWNVSVSERDGSFPSDEMRRFVVRMNSDEVIEFELPYHDKIETISLYDIGADANKVSDGDWVELLNFIQREFFNVNGEEIGETHSVWVPSVNDYAEITEIAPDGEDFEIEDSRQFNVVMRESGDESSYHYFVGSFAECKDANGNEWEPEAEIINEINDHFITKDDEDIAADEFEASMETVELKLGGENTTLFITNNSDEESVCFEVDFNDLGQVENYYWLKGEFSHAYDEKGNDTATYRKIIDFIEETWPKTINRDSFK